MRSIPQILPLFLVGMLVPSIWAQAPAKNEDRDALKPEHIAEILSADRCRGLKPQDASQSVTQLIAEAKLQLDLIQQQTRAAEAAGVRPAKVKGLTPEQKVVVANAKKLKANSEKFVKALQASSKKLEQLYQVRVAQAGGQEDEQDDVRANCADHLSDLQVLVQVTAERMLNPNWQLAIRLEPLKIPLQNKSKASGQK